MKTFLCRVCGHVAFDEAPVDCPVCGAAIENFENEPDAVKKTADPADPNETTKQHVPYLEVNTECGLTPDVPCIDVHVRVGEIMHVMESEHLIDFIDLYINKRYIARASLTHKVLYPAASFHFSTHEGIITAVASCNVHGHWMNRVIIKEK